MTSRRILFVFISFLTALLAVLALRQNTTRTSNNSDFASIRREIEALVDPAKRTGSNPELASYARKSMDEWKEHKSDARLAYAAAYSRLLARDLDVTFRRMEINAPEFDLNGHDAGGKTALSAFKLDNSYEFTRCRFLYESSMVFTSKKLCLLADKLLERDPEDIPVLSAYVWLNYTVDGSPEKAKRMMQKVKPVADKHPDNFRIQLVLARCYAYVYHFDRSNVASANKGLRIFERLPTLTYADDPALAASKSDMFVLKLEMKEKRK